MQTPAVAPLDSQKPTDHTSIGSMSTRIETVDASSRTTDRWRPRTYAEQPSMAMTPARSTDGSKRVRAMNHPISPMVAAHRHHGRSRREQRRRRGQHERHVLAGHRGEMRQARRAKCADHLRRLAGVVADHQPVNNAASSTPIVDSAERRRAVRTRDEVRYSGEPSRQSPTTATSRRPTT